MKADQLQRVFRVFSDPTRIRILALLDPDDPVKYDFALCHLGVSRECPSRPDPIKCERCVLQTVCSVWTTGRRHESRASEPNSAKEPGELRL